MHERTQLPAVEGPWKVFSSAGAGGTEAADGQRGQEEEEGTGGLESGGGTRGDEQRGSRCVHHDQASLNLPQSLIDF